WVLATAGLAALAAAAFESRSAGVARAAETAGATEATLPSGELIYVPVYSSILYEDGKRKLQLDATLSIHNVNPDRPITVTRADYFNADGTLIKKHVGKPTVLGPLQTLNLVVAKTAGENTVGANFLVEWQAAGEVNSPIVETLMVNASSNLGASFTSTGRVLKRLPPLK
ncbi:MAG TPA: DUF3124 domain-containing protein, partial [Pirellulales bacterium]|nr:DUF3124 domain-containing protein [Pirellulales bacterium]